MWQGILILWGLLGSGLATLLWRSRRKAEKLAWHEGYQEGCRQTTRVWKNKYDKLVKQIQKRANDPDADSYHIRVREPANPPR